ncbi:hypothetical protein T484DRAFT_1818802 [Baffinella frigidus]|nr:hypothetical protein T484DRAFT_1818802 [Cryptophyta sp. CCMP2293]
MRFKRRDGWSIYTGMFSEGKRHGQGTFSCPPPKPKIGSDSSPGESPRDDPAADGDRGMFAVAGEDDATYEGEWAGGKRHGKGKFIKPDGSYYEGVRGFSRSKDI